MLVWRVAVKHRKTEQFLYILRSLRSMGALLSSETSVPGDHPFPTATATAAAAAAVAAPWPSPAQAAKVGIVSFNMLAPCYRRISQRNALGRRLRESHTPEAWQRRATDTQSFLERSVCGPAHGIIALQEFWLDPAYRQSFDAKFVAAGYSVCVLKRRGQKADGVALLVRDAEFSILARQEVQLAENCDRVALLLWLAQKDSGQHVVVANTHLTFPHSEDDKRLQVQQVQSLISAVDLFCLQKNVPHSCLHAVVGDFNVETDSAACELLRHEGYRSAFQMRPPSNGGEGGGGSSEQHVGSRQRQCSRSSVLSSDNSVDEEEEEAEGKEEAGADAEDVKRDGGRGRGRAPASPSSAGSSGWVSHRTHREEELGVDHIFIRHAQQLPVVTDTSVLPATQSCVSWDSAFTISDHRPVRATIALPGKSN